jgi:hypothetical protein
MTDHDRHPRAHLGPRPRLRRPQAARRVLGDPADDTFGGAPGEAMSNKGGRQPRMWEWIGEEGATTFSY